MSLPVYDDTSNNIVSQDTLLGYAISLGAVVRQVVDTTQASFFY